MRPASLSRATRLTNRISIATRKPPHLSFSQLAPTSVAKLLDRKAGNEVGDVVVNGFVRSVRHMKSQSFVSLGDGSSLAPLQALVPPDRSEGCE